MLGNADDARHCLVHLLVTVVPYALQLETTAYFEYRYSHLGKLSRPSIGTLCASHLTAVRRFVFNIAYYAVQCR